MKFEQVYPSDTLVTTVCVVVRGGEGGEEHKEESHGRVVHVAARGADWRNVR